MYDPKDQIKFSEVSNVHVLELPKIPRNSDKTKLWDWLYFFSASKKEEFDVVAKNDGAVNTAVTKLKMISRDARVRMLYEAREKARMDLSVRMRAATEEGVQQGLQRGRQEGRLEEKANTAKNLLKMNVDVGIIEAVTGLSREEIEKIRR